MALLLSAAEAAAADKAAEPAPLVLQREVAQLRLERELSAGKGFYLRLDAGRQRLALMLQGVTLDDYATNGLELGVPEVLFVDRRPPSDWDIAPISKGRLDPARQRDRTYVMAPAPAASTPPAASASPAPSPAPPPIPKSAEESVSVPSPYRIVFAEGVSLEVRTSGAGGRNRSALRRLLDAIGLRLSDLGSALGLGAQERVRLRVTLAADDAAALYRSLPPDVGLVVAGLAQR
jgi:pyruvate/2-oxoglutarate dehydrogenase complex dihydrolipoamide acyltransferase (E2) component